MTYYPQNMVTSSVTVETFDTIGNFSASGGTAEANVTEYHEGTASVKVTPTSAGGLVTATRQSLSLDLSTCQCLRLWVYLHQDKVAGDGIGLTLVTVDGPPKQTFSHWWTETMYAGWNVLTVAPSEMGVGNGAVWSAPVITVQVSLQAAPATTPSVTFDALLSVDSEPAVMFAFDDQFAEVYAVAAPILAAHNMKATVYCIGERFDAAGRMTTAQCQELDAVGWAMANHSMTHPLFTDLETQGEVEEELTDGRDILIAAGLTRAASMVAYPGGEFDAKTLAAMTATGMVCGRTIGGQFRYLPHADIRRVGGISLNSGCPIADAKAYVDSAVARGVVADFYTHKLLAESDETNYSIADFTALVEYVDSLGVRVMTIDEWYAKTQQATATSNGAIHSEPFYTPTCNAGTWTKGPYTYLS